LDLQVSISRSPCASLALAGSISRRGLAKNAVSDCLFAPDAGHVVRFADGWQAWCDQRAAAGSKTISRTRKKLSKLTRDNGGDVAVESFSTDPRGL
jgi:hypothetical protein